MIRYPIVECEALLKCVEGDSLRSDLKKTPERMARAMLEMFDGYTIDIRELLSSDHTFQGEGKDQIVAVRDIVTWSTCEHHFLPFKVCAHVAYLPKDSVVGVSKIERLVCAFSHRLQLQERITQQVADAIMQYLEPQGVAVILNGEHLCMRMRGVKSQSSQVVTSVMLGAFRDNPSTRMEALSLLGLKNGG